MNFVVHTDVQIMAMAKMGKTPFKELPLSSLICPSIDFEVIQPRRWEECFQHSPFIPYTKYSGDCFIRVACPPPLATAFCHLLRGVQPRIITYAIIYIFWNVHLLSGFETLIKNVGAKEITLHYVCRVTKSHQLNQLSRGLGGRYQLAEPDKQLK